MQSSSVASRAAAGTATTASHTSSGTAATVGQTGSDRAAPSRSTLRIVVRFGLTACTGTLAVRVMLRHSTEPTVSGRSDAPTTAIERGRSSRAIARLSARCSRSASESRYSWVDAIGKSTSMTPLSYVRCNGHPARAKTLSIARFSASTSAVKRSMPFDVAMAARCSSSRVAIPLPWWASSTMKAVSASSRPGQRS